MEGSFRSRQLGMAQGWKEVKGLGTRCTGKMCDDVRVDQDVGAGRVAWRVAGGAGTGGPLTHGEGVALPWPS